MNHRLPLLGLGIVLACAAQGSVAQTELSVETRANPIESLRTQADYQQRLPIPGRDYQPEVDVDIGGVLYHLQRGSHQAAQQELYRLQGENPGWQPPLALTRLLQQTRSSDPDHHYLSLMAELSNTPKGAVLAIPEEKLEQAANGAEQREDGYHSIRLGWLYYDRHADTQAEQQFNNAQRWGESERAREGLATLAQRQAQLAVQNSHYPLALEHAKRAHELGNKDAFLTTAWQIYDTGDYLAAAQFFAAHQPSNEASTFGHALAYHRAGDKHAAQQLACAEAKRSARLLKLCTDLVSSEMLANYRAGEHEALAEQAAILEQLDSLPPDLQALMAWSTLNAGHHQAAAERFEHLLVRQGDNHSHAHGLINSLLLSQQPSALESARKRHPIVEQVMAQRSGNYDPTGNPRDDAGQQLAHAIVLYHNGDYESAWTILSAHRSQLFDNRDGGMLIMMGWAAYHTGRFTQARDSFADATPWSDSASTALMQAEAEIALGNLEQAEGILSQQPPSKERDVMLDRLLLLHAHAAQQNNEYAHAEALLANSQRPLNAEGLELLAWSQYQQQKYQAASIQFEAAYRLEASASRARGLVFSHMQLSQPRQVVSLALELGGPLLQLTSSSEVAQELADGRDNWIAVNSDGELIVTEPEKQLSSFARGLQRFQAIPGYTWGSLDRNLIDHDKHVSFLINQGVDWLELPGRVTLNTFAEYRSIHNEWQSLYDDDELVLGLELKHSVFKLGIEHAPARWRGNADSTSSTHAYLSWYHDWYQFLRRRGTNTWNPLNVGAYEGSIYGRVTHDLDSKMTTVHGTVRQGMDWFTANTSAGEFTVNTYAAYRYRFRSDDNYWYDAHGPAIGLELNRSPFSLGIDYMRQHNPRRSTTEDRYGLYLTWYFDWNLRPE